VDNARLKLISADLTAANAELKEWKGKAEKRAGLLIILLMAIGFYIFLKLKK
jgi:hypothetical protein